MTINCLTFPTCRKSEIIGIIGIIGIIEDLKELHTTIGNTHRKAHSNCLNCLNCLILTLDVISEIIDKRGYKRVLSKLDKATTQFIWAGASDKCDYVNYDVLTIKELSTFFICPTVITLKEGISGINWS